MKRPENSYYRDLSGCSLYDIKNKKKSAENMTRYMLSRTSGMFKWSGLPETIPARELEKILQCNGFAVITEHQGNLYAFEASLGGETNEYYFPTLAIVTNPALDFSKELEIGKDCVLIRNDFMMQGLLPILGRFNSLKVEADITIMLNLLQSRIISLITAGTQNTLAAADEYMEKIAAGDLSIIADNAFIEGIKTQPYGSPAQTAAFTDLIELRQYLDAAEFNFFGLNSNTNYKREAINSIEAGQNTNANFTFTDNMHESRLIGCEDMKKVYGQDWGCEFGGQWELTKEQLEEEPEEKPEEEPAPEEDTEEVRDENTDTE